MYKKLIVAVLTVLCFRGNGSAVPETNIQSQAVATKQTSFLKECGILGAIWFGSLAFVLILIKIDDKIWESSDTHKKFLEYKKNCEEIELNVPQAFQESAKQMLWYEEFVKKNLDA